MALRIEKAFGVKMDTPRRKSFTTETRSFSFFRVFSVISVPPWSIFISIGAPQAHVTLMRTQSSYGIAQARKREKQIHVRRIR